MYTKYSILSYEVACSQCNIIWHCVFFGNSKFHVKMSHFLFVFSHGMEIIRHWFFNIVLWGLFQNFLSKAPLRPALRVHFCRCFIKLYCVTTFVRSYVKHMKGLGLYDDHFRQFSSHKWWPGQFLSLVTVQYRLVLHECSPWWQKRSVKPRVLRLVCLENITDI